MENLLSLPFSFPDQTQLWCLSCPPQPPWRNDPLYNSIFDSGLHRVPLGRVTVPPPCQWLASASRSRATCDPIGVHVRDVPANYSLECVRFHKTGWNRKIRFRPQRWSLTASSGFFKGDGTWWENMAYYSFCSLIFCSHLQMVRKSMETEYVCRRIVSSLTRKLTS